MTQNEKAKLFTEMHIKGEPMRLYNAWDAGSAKAILGAGATVVATSSWAVAEAQGFRDGEAVPLAMVYQIVGRITASVEAPVTVDFEGGYSDDDGQLTENIGHLLETGIIGINFEDRFVKGAGLYDIARQASRIASIRKAAAHKGIDLFINARTDLFLGQGRNPAEAELEAVERAKAYSAAGASGFFVPGLVDAGMIGRICDSVPLPVNVMVMKDVPSHKHLAELGVARISYGATPYIQAIASLKAEAQQALS
jgi:2-methylisocitrate lyase-like PEP mutase family enzyme